MGTEKTYSSIAVELTDFAREIKSQGISSATDALRKQSLIKSIFSFAIDWAVIALSMFLVLKVSIWWLGAAIILIGSRQRALSNLVHEGSHGNLFSRIKVNDVVVNIFAGLPMGETVRNYRKSHVMHHACLGDFELDPDIRSHRRYGFDDFKSHEVGFMRNYLALLMNFKSWRDSMVGSFFELSKREVIVVVSWWIIFLAAISIVDSQLLWTVPALWFLSRVTGYHAVRIFAEFMDHSGLRPGSVIGFTRNIPGAAWPLRYLFHPHADNFHLVHHLLPKTPHYRLADAHEVLLKNERYMSGHHCDGYFAGKYSAVSSWSRSGSH